MNVNEPVLGGYLKIATKYNLQDISFRAMAGRIKKVTGIEITPTELLISMSDEADELSRKSQAKFEKFYKWVYKQAGEYIIDDLESVARPHVIHMLQLYLLGFATSEVMTKKVKVTKAMSIEGGGIAIPDWVYVLNSIEEHKFQQAKRKPKAVAKVSGNDNVSLSSNPVIEKLVKLGFNFKKVKSPHHVAVMLDAPTKVSELKALGKKLKAVKGNLTFENQLRSMVEDLEGDGDYQLYMVMVDERSDNDLALSIDLKGNVSVADY